MGSFSDSTPRRRGAMIAEKLANLGNGSNQYQKVGVTNGTATVMTREQAAEKLSTTPKAISQARFVREWARVNLKKYVVLLANKIVAGPFATAAEAVKARDALQARGVELPISPV